VRATVDVLVIGAGVIGCAVARALAAAGLSVCCVDRGAVGGEASTAAAGVLAVASGGEGAGPALALRRAALAAHARLAPALADATGIDVEHEATGVLELADDPEAAAARAAARRALGFRVAWLDRAALGAAAPGVDAGAPGALHFADDACVHPARLVAALATAARRAGADVVPGTPVSAVAWQADRIVRVRTGASWVSAGEVVLAAGAWSPRVPGLAPALAVRPARGQMLALRPREPPARAVVTRGDAYLVPRAGGEVWVGATVEDSGFARGVTPAGLAALRAHVAALAPALLEAPVVRVWSGLRPWAPGGGPSSAGRRTRPIWSSPPGITATGSSSRPSRRTWSRRSSGASRRRSTRRRSCPRRCAGHRVRGWRGARSCSRRRTAWRS
jgi:glycine oxidase